MNLIESLPPDLILLDINLPEINGVAFLRVVKSRRPWLPVIIVTGVMDDVVGRKAMSAGAAEYVTKPCDMGYLETSIKANLAALS